MTQQVEAEAPEEIDAEAIDLDFSAVPRDTVVAHEVGGELLLIDRQSGVRHVLNPVGSVVWQCLDQGGTLGDLVGDLAEGFGVPTEMVESDVLTLARAVGRAGLLQGVARFRPEQSGMGMPSGLGVGEEVTPFTLPDLDGAPVDLAAMRGKSVLLVNWSPGCGYCTMIAPALAKMHGDLIGQGVELVLLTGGDVDSNRALFDEHNLAPTVMLRSGAEEGFEDPFPGMGTPVAYLLDEEGLVAMPVAEGAMEVPGLVRYAAGLPAEVDEQPGDGAGDEDEADHDRHDHAGHDHDGHGHDGHGHDGHGHDEGTGEDAAPAGPKYLRRAGGGGGGGGMCGPGATQAKSARVWFPTSAYAVGEYHIGVRADSEATDELLRGVFAAHALPLGTEVPDDFSVVLGEQGKRGARGLNLLLSGGVTVVRSRSPKRVLHALAAHLSTVLDVEDRDGLLQTANAAAVVGGSAVLLPSVVIQWLEQLQPRLTKLGLRLVDEPLALIDPDTLELVVPAPGVELNQEALAAIDEPRPSRSELPRVEPGRYPLRAWALWVDEETRAEFSLARAVGAGLGTVHADRDAFDALLIELKQVFERVRPIPLTFESPEALVESLDGQLDEVA